MVREPARPRNELSPPEIRDALSRVLASSWFVSSERSSDFLRYVVEHALDHSADPIKEYSIGLEVFDRGPSFDPRTDTIVRVQAGRLRQRLAQYYAAEGRGDPVVIEIPKGSYAARFISAASLRRKPRRRAAKWRIGLAAATLAVLVVADSSNNAEPMGRQQPELRMSKLTSEPGIERRPSFSPDGRRVAYVVGGNRGGQSDIHVRLAEPGAAPIRVTSGAWDVEPSWSPDGSRLLFARILDSQTGHVGTTFKLMSAPPVEDAEVDEVTSRAFHSRNPGAIKPSWSPDARGVIFSCKLDPTVNQSQICAYFPQLDTLERLTFPMKQGVGDADPALSPNGRMVAFLSSSYQGDMGIFVQALTPEMKPDGDPWRLPGAAGAHWVGWSRDSETVYFMGIAKNGERGLWSVEASPNAEARLLWTGSGREATYWEGEGGELRIAYRVAVRESDVVLVGLQAGSAESSAKVLAPSTAADFHPQFSPDGKQVAFMSDRSGKIGVWTARLDDADPSLLAEVGPFGLFSVPKWSPGGERITVDGFHGFRNAYIVDVATQQIGPPLTDDGSRLPTWTKDGKGVYYYSDRGGLTSLWRVDLRTNTHQRLLDAPGLLHPAESPDGENVYFLQSGNLMRAPVEGGGPPELVERDVAAFALAGHSVYLRKRSGQLLRRDLRTGEDEHLLTTDGRSNVPNLGIAVSRDERWLAYTRWVREESDVQLLESSPDRDLLSMGRTWP